MVGDWVYNKHHDKNIRLTPYDFFTHTHNEFGEQELAPFAKPTIGKDLEPIPLTPEILEKNGFIRGMFYGEWQFDLDSFPFSVVQRENNSWYLGREEHGIAHNREIIDISYVHELQHALRLCGIEKEIEL